MMAGLVDNSHYKQPMVNGFLLDRDSVYLANDRQISQMEQKEMLMRERREQMLREREREMMARQHAMMEQKHYMPAASIALDSASDLLGKLFIKYSLVWSADLQ